jgi:hypothetical protein
MTLLPLLGLRGCITSLDYFSLYNFLLYNFYYTIFLNPKGQGDGEGKYKLERRYAKPCP